MIIVPDGQDLEGLPTSLDTDGPYVMWRGTPYEHIMLPVDERPAQRTGRLGRSRRPPRVARSPEPGGRRRRRRSATGRHRAGRVGRKPCRAGTARTAGRLGTGAAPWQTAAHDLSTRQGDPRRPQRSPQETPAETLAETPAGASPGPTGPTGGRPLHVVVGAGPLGLAVAREALAQGHRVRLVSRRGRIPDAPPAAMRSRAADARHPEPAPPPGGPVPRRSIIVPAAPYDRWQQTLPASHAGP